MYEFIEGNIVEVNPAMAVVNNSGIGYLIHLSLTTFTQIQHQQHVKLYIHQVIREDAHLLFGFATLKERETFRLLISVSGVGANTARMILSSMNPDEVQNAIASGDVGILKSIKGIGVKSAQRIIVDLKDKVAQPSGEQTTFLPGTDNTIPTEALSALVTLGFQKKQAEKVIDTLYRENPDLTVEQLIKQALKLL